MILQKLKNRDQSGLTLVEMIIYIALLGIVLGMILQLFWQVQIADSIGRLERELKENASQVLSIMSRSMREANDVNTVSSVYDVHPGTLSLATSSGTITIDTYTKNVAIGQSTTNTTKLRYQLGANPALDLTSDHIDVTEFKLTELQATGDPDSIQIDLSLASVNPGSDPNYDKDLSIRSALTIRKEL